MPEGYSSGNECLPHLRSQYPAFKNMHMNGNKPERLVSTGNSLCRIPPDDLGSGLFAGNSNCEKPTTTPTSISLSRRVLQTLPRSLDRVRWISLKKETPFRHLLGYQRQTPLHLSDLLKSENNGLQALAFLGFQIATAPNISAVVDRTSVGLHPPLRDSSFQTEYAILEPPAGSTNPSEDLIALLRSRALGSETSNEKCPSPTLEAWFHDLNLESSDIYYVPGLFQSQQIARKKQKTTEVLESIDLVLGSLVKLNIRRCPDECPKVGAFGTGFNQNSCGNRGQNDNGGRSAPNQDTTGGTANSKFDASRGQGEKKRPRDDDPSDEGKKHPSKQSRSKKPSLEARTKFLCTYYQHEADLEVKGNHKCKTQTFENHKELCQHLRGVHIKPYQCPRCYTRYGRSNERDRHVRGKTCYPHESIQNYVVEFGEKILNSTEDGLYEILYVNGKKQYDLLDQTDELQPARPGAVEAELIESLAPPVSPGKQVLKSAYAASPKSPKIPVSNHRDEFLALLDKEYKLAEKSGEAAVEQFMQQLITKFPPAARLVLGYMLKVQKDSSFLEREGVDDTSLVPQPSSVGGHSYVEQPQPVIIGRKEYFSSVGAERQQYSYMGGYGDGGNQSGPSQGLGGMAFAGGNTALGLFPDGDGIGSVVAGIRSDSGFISSQHGDMSGRFAHPFGDPPTGDPESGGDVDTDWLAMVESNQFGE